MKATDADQRPSMSASFDRQGISDTRTIDGTASGVVHAFGAVDLLKEAQVRCTATKDGRSPQEPTGMTPSRRRPGRVGWWVRRLGAVTSTLLLNVAVAAPAFAWPECAC